MGGEIEIPVAKHRHIAYDIVGKHIDDYDSIFVLSHFKGHPMGGFGGALKNVSIGIASSNGKRWIHSVGRWRPTTGWKPTKMTSSNRWLKPTKQ